MRIVIDLQGAQCGSRHRGIGRYSLALAEAMVKNRGQHDIIIVLSGLFIETIEPIRTTFEKILPPEKIIVWHANGPVDAFNSENDWRRKTAELTREAFLISLNPDVVHIASLIEGFGDDAIHSIGLLPFSILTAVTFYDVIPLIQQDVYLTPHKVFETLYREKLTHLAKANLFLAISESSRLEAVKYLGVQDEQTVNISAAADDIFKPLELSYSEVQITRKRFGLTRPFVMYSGATDERKNHLRLIKAFSLLPKKLRENYQLAIVGGLPPHHKKKFEEYIVLCGLSRKDVIITDRVGDDDMVRLYNLCELFVFPSWHEGFGLPALEAMSCGAPVIAANTTSLPEVIGRSDALFNPFDENDIAHKIELVLGDQAIKENLAKHGLLKAKEFSWDRSAKTAIKSFEKLVNETKIRIGEKTSKTSEDVQLLNSLISNISDLKDKPTGIDELLKLASSISKNYPPSEVRTMFVDVSQLVRVDSKTGVQRVVRGILAELLSNPPECFKVQLVYAVPGETGYHHAADFTNDFLGIDGDLTSDSMVDVFNGDIFLGLDFQPYVVSEQVKYFENLRRIGAKVYFVVYDLLPVLNSNFFADDASINHSQWLRAITKTDGALCISRSVAEELNRWLNVFGADRKRPFYIGWFHLGSEAPVSSKTLGLPADSEIILNNFSKRTTFLSVGTIEPRKGHLQTLTAFEKLWAQGVNVNLVLVGKHGWNVDLLVEILRNHTERNRKLFWLEGVSDEYLEKIYSNASCLIAASEGEGFGLPLIEAAHRGLPIIARDIPVFREVAGENAFYFSGLESDALANRIKTWLENEKLGITLFSKKIPRLSWRQSTTMLLDIILEKKWYKTWMPDNTYRVNGADPSLGTQVGQRIRYGIESTGKPGYLLFGSYIDLKAGDFKVTLFGKAAVVGSPVAYMDVTSGRGNVAHGFVPISHRNSEGLLATMNVSFSSNADEVEVRVWVSAQSIVTVQMIIITPLPNVKANGEPIEY
jgi:glycosyltransferase involved in cell wall biosynthesis